MQNPLILTIHGRRYDLTNLNHPGGREILELSSNEPDCTALFESYHAFCDQHKIKQLMGKYVIPVDEKDPPVREMFRFCSNGFYFTLRNRVIEHLETKLGPQLGRRLQRSDVKADHRWVFTVVFLLFVFLISQASMMCSSFPWLVRAVSGFLSGVGLAALGFVVLHDGSHYAITADPTNNRFLSTLFQGLSFWNHTLWTYHHVVRHHQYTGSVLHDPDTRHSMPYFRKSSRISKIPFFGKALFPLSFLMFNIVFPGSAFGQALMYHLIWVRRGNLWKMKLPESFGVFDKMQIFQYLLSFCFMACMVWFGGPHTIFHIIGTNLAYFVGLSPDHDLFPTHKETEQFKTTDQHDWGEMQVRASANFCNSWRWYTLLMGGINYQIEHHLFPSLSNLLLPEIAPIVRQTCLEFGIEYNHIDSPIEVLRNLFATYYDVFDSEVKQSGEGPTEDLIADLIPDKKTKKD